MGRPFGIPVYVSPTWFIVAAVITLTFAPQIPLWLPGIGVGRYLVAFAFAVLLYVSVFVHELSHSLVARGFGLPVRQITLYLLGGVSEIEKEPQTPAREFLVAVAGPVVSLLLGLAGFGLHRVLPTSTVAGLLVYELAFANLLVGVFNMLPGLPLDGGRMLRAGVWKISGDAATGSVAAAWAGRVIGVLVFLVPFGLAAARGSAPQLYPVIWGALVGSFIWSGASQSLRVSRLRTRLPGVAARPLARRAVPVESDLPLAEALRRAGGDGYGIGLVVVDPAGVPIALVNEAAVRATPTHRQPWVNVAAMARTLESGHVLSADLHGAELLLAMQGTPASEYLLVEDGGQISGVLVADDVQRAFSRRGAK